MTVGLVGYGFVGQALGAWLTRHNPSARLKINDPDKGFTDDLSDCDAYFI